MTEGLDEGPTEEDRRLAADHDDEGVDVALAMARVTWVRTVPTIMSTTTSTTTRST